MARDSFHVVSRYNGKWSIRKTGENRALHVFNKRTDAIIFARSAAKNNCGEIIIHGRDGRIREVRSYGKDPCPPQKKRLR